MVQQIVDLEWCEEFAKTCRQLEITIWIGSKIMEDVENERIYRTNRSRAQRN